VHISSSETFLDRAVGAEEVEVHAARHHGDPARVRPEAQKLEDLVAARGDDPVDGADDLALLVDPFRGARVLWTQVSALDDTEHVERLQDRCPEQPSRGERGAS
jgi:hypothetical protein